MKKEKNTKYIALPLTCWDIYYNSYILKIKKPYTIPKKEKQESAPGKRIPSKP